MYEVKTRKGLTSSIPWPPLRYISATPKICIGSVELGVSFCFPKPAEEQNYPNCQSEKKAGQMEQNPIRRKPRRQMLVRLERDGVEPH